MAVLIYLALAKFALHMLTNGQYGYYVDELYYMAAGEHLDWGYTEFPPLVALIAQFSRWLLGDSLSAIRLFPAIAGAGLVLLTGLMARELGGGRFAQCLAAVSVMTAPYYLFMHTILTMNALEPLLWTLCAYLIILIIKDHRPQLWLWVGLVGGIGVLNKYSIVFFGISLLVGLLITYRSRSVNYQWLGLAVVIALVISLPNLFWQYQHGFPFLEHQTAATLYDKKPTLQSAIDLLVQPILFMHPFTFPIWMAGLYFYFQTKAGKPYRFLGWSYIVLLGLFIVLDGKYYYLAPIYPLLLAPGAIVIEQFIHNHRRFQKTIFALLIVSTLFMLPMVLPVLPIKVLMQFSLAYESIYTLPNAANKRFTEQQAPLHYRLMLGWEELVNQVSKAYHQLTPDEQAKTAILAWSYGNAGAIDLYGKAYGLPKVISGAHTYYFWGPRDYTGERVLSVGGDREKLQQLFNQIEQVATITYTSVGIQDNIPIYLCRDIKIPLPESWSNFKAYFGRAYPSTPQKHSMSVFG